METGIFGSSLESIDLIVGLIKMFFRVVGVLGMSSFISERALSLKLSSVPNFELCPRMVVKSTLLELSVLYF